MGRNCLHCGGCRMTCTGSSFGQHAEGSVQSAQHRGRCCGEAITGAEIVRRAAAWSPVADAVRFKRRATAAAGA